MKREDIYEGIGGIGPDLIEEAEKHVFAPRRRTAVRKWAAAAAAAVLFLVLGGVGAYAAAGGFTVRKLLVNGYKASASISRIPMQKIKGRVNEAAGIIIEQYKSLPVYSSQARGAYYRQLGSAEEAAAYVGYDKLQVPAFPYDQSSVAVSVTGDPQGRLKEILIMQEYITKRISVQNWTTLFTTNCDRDVFMINYPGDVAAGMTEFMTGAGYQCLVFESRAEAADRHGLSAYITTGDVVYMCHTAFYTSDRAEAEKIIRDWAESFQ